MYRALDENRDQSYFLFNTTKEQLNYGIYFKKNIYQKRIKRVITFYLNLL
jgi:tRNA U34 2-thiouridine synthase MnmA/TrmU